MPRLKAFPAVAGPTPHTLILGSMPGAASLAAGEYYAHPRNLFWPIVCELLAIPIDTAYQQRIARLAEHGFALWDVLGACRRAGSLDAAIDPDSLEVNDFASFLDRHPRIERIFFNGAFAEQTFRRRALPTLPAERAQRLALTRLPSTSPANASIPAARKRAEWAQLVA